MTPRRWTHEQLLASNYTAEQVDTACEFARLVDAVLAGEITLAAYDDATAEARRVCGSSLSFLRVQHAQCHAEARA